MKNVIALFLLLTLALSASALALEIDFTSLSDAEPTQLIAGATAELDQRQPASAEAPHIPVAINPSPDKYTWYIQDYIGRNAASFGYTSRSGD